MNIHMKLSHYVDMCLGEKSIKFSFTFYLLFHAIYDIGMTETA